MSDNNLVTKSDLGEFYGKILPYLGSGLKLAGPVGMIISYMGNTAPSGYLACDGSWFDIGDYPKLANWMMSEFGSYSYFALSGETVQSGKFKVPDLRGEFLRGTGTNSHANQGSGANVGEHQDGTELLSMGVDGSGKLLHRGSETYWANTYKADSQIGISQTKQYSCSSVASDVTATISPLITSRPTNTSVLYCIKYEEYEGDGAGEVYSTDERLVGTWIDGKPLYQKTIQTTTPVSTSSSNNTVTQEVSISNVDTVVSVNGFIKTSTNQNIPLPSVWVSGFLAGILSTIVSASKVNVTIYVAEASHTTWKNAPAYITLQYTKTTD